MLKKQPTLFFSYFFIGLMLIVLLSTHTRGFISHDEGLFVNPAYRMINGEAPYKDYHFYYFPGSLLVYGAVLSIVKSLLALRLAAVIVSLVSTILMYKICFSITKDKIQTYLLTVIFLFLGPLTINFLSPTMLAIPTSLAAIYLISYKKKWKNAAIFSGLMSGLVLVFKQNFAGAVIIACITAILIEQRKTFWLSSVHFALGFFLGILPSLIFLMLVGSLSYFINSIYYFIYEKTILMGLQVTPFIYPDNILNITIKFMAYCFPFFVSFIAIIVSWKSKKKYLPYAIFTLFFYIFGIRPTTDYIHLAPTLAVSVISLGILFICSKGKISQSILYACCFTLLAVGIINVGFRHYYRWDSPIRQHTIFLSNPRVLLFGNRMADKSIREYERILAENYRSNNYVFFYGFMPMYYFITDTNNPTRFDFLPPLSPDEEQEIITDLIRSNTQLIITQNDVKNDSSQIGRFIREKYTQKKYPIFTAWIKN